MLVNWISTDVGYPIPFKEVLVAGGCAYWDGKDWYTCMENNRPKIVWTVKYWATLPKSPVGCPDCVKLELELTELKSKIASLC